jgi:hypothetical protein
MPSESSYLWLKIIHGLSVFEIVTWYVKAVVGGIDIMVGIKDSTILRGSVGLKDDDLFLLIIMFIFMPVSIVVPTLILPCIEGLNLS